MSHLSISMQRRHSLDSSAASFKPWHGEESRELTLWETGNSASDGFFALMSLRKPLPMPPGDIPAEMRLPTSPAFAGIANPDSLLEGRDFVFPSMKMSGKVPVSAGVFVADHLRTATKNSGVRIPEGRRFGLHNLRHSLSNWMAN
jgi:hypothetical protein